MKGTRSFGLYFLIISAGLLITSFFIEWISGYTLFQMYSHFRFTPTFVFYLFPFFAIILLLIGVLLTISDQSFWKKFAFLLLFLDLNLIFIFLIQMIQIHGIFLWQHPGIYLGIISTAFFLLGFVLLLNTSLTKSKSNE